MALSLRVLLTSTTLAAALFVTLASSRAETNQVRIASTYGLAQLPGRLAYEQKFIEKHAKALGIPDLKVTFQPVSSGIVVSDLLLSGNADVGVGGERSAVRAVG